MDSLKHVLDEIELEKHELFENLSAPRLRIDDYCDKLRNQLDLMTESAIEHLNDLKTDFLKQIDDYERGLLRSLDERRNEARIHQAYKQLKELDTEVSAIRQATESIVHLEEVDVQRSLEIAKNIKSRLRETAFNLQKAHFNDRFLKFTENDAFYESSYALGYMDMADLEVDFKEKRSLDQTANALAVLKSGDFAIGTSDANIQIRNKYYGILIRTLIGHTKSVRSLAVLNSGDLASGSDDKTVRIWNPNDGTLLRTLHGHSDTVNSLVVLQSDQLVSSSPSQPTIKIWNPNDGRLQTFEDQRWNQSLVSLPCGVLGRKPNAGLKIWTIDGSESTYRFENDHREAWTLAAMPFGYLAVGTFRGSIHVLLLEDDVYRMVRSLNGHTGTITSLVALNNLHLASGSVDKTLRIWNAADGHLIRTLVGHSSRIHLLAVMNNGDLISCSDNKKLKIWRKIE